ncbi:hypothetical protein ASE48_08490 [Mycobacterium sp. Root265]|uniref:hypothetical protein n=1 Tax=Mycobacterium sp. Root265 TaxID=1736504 RepID=UPI0007096C14|nr:hypothetical protein [Mycobacterium sp. Root265]KRD08592.1 hypothetical protein ASE48_08490 [Mycobacterium sp. Root265]
MTTTETRKLSAIAAEINEVWPKVYFAALPYLEAMSELTSITDSYYQDSAEDIVRRFVLNAATWRGEDARRIKAELKGMYR